MDLGCDADEAFYLTEHTGWSLSAEKASHLTRLSEDIVLSFICDGCGGYGECWIQATGDKHWFRCSFCGMHYKPWAGARSLYGANLYLYIIEFVQWMLQLPPW